ncbi:MAG: hypothetical protein LBF38_08105, partial [Deltaproteobacteria bacterium]|nr:hypothetical protein [Deltaproteobacteria bacterium]
IDAIVVAQNLYFTDNNRYARSYDDLANLSLTKDDKVNYGPIIVYDFGNEYSFTVSLKARGSPLLIYDSTFTEKKYRIVEGEGLTSSVW